MAKSTVAGPGSTVNPKRPAYKADKSSGYDPAEDVNQGPHGGKKGKVTPALGQSSGAVDYDNETAEKNRLISWTENQQDPYRAKGDDFTDKKVVAETGQSTGAEWPTSDSPQKNKLAMESENQCGARHVEDDGPGEYGSGTPVPGDRNSRVAANFKIEQNDGESESGDTGEVGIGTMVNLQTGAIEGGHSQTIVGEVPEDSVTISGSSPFKYSDAGAVQADLKGDDSPFKGSPKWGSRGTAPWK